MAIALQFLLGRIADFVAERFPEFRSPDAVVVATIRAEGDIIDVRRVPYWWTITDNDWLVQKRWNEFREAPAHSITLVRTVQGLFTHSGVIDAATAGWNAEPVQERRQARACIGRMEV